MTDSRKLQLPAPDTQSYPSTRLIRLRAANPILLPLLSLGFIAILLTGGIAALWLGGVAGFDSSLLCLTTDAVGHFLRHFSEVLGPWAAVGSVILLVLHSFIPLPAEVIAVANGIIFGPLWGIVITWLGAMLGAFLSFGLTRMLGRDLVRYWVEDDKLRKFDMWFDRSLTLILIRLIPAISFNLVNYAAGLLRVSWWRFSWTTGLGILPITIASVLLGERLAGAAWWVWIILGTAVLLLWFGLHRFGPQLTRRVFGARSVN